MAYDIIIKNGSIVDGTGAPRYKADIGIVDGKIKTIGQIDDEAKEVIDANGLILI